MKYLYEVRELLTEKAKTVNDIRTDLLINEEIYEVGKFTRKQEHEFLSMLADLEKSYNNMMAFIEDLREDNK